MFSRFFRSAPPPQPATPAPAQTADPAPASPHIPPEIPSLENAPEKAPENAHENAPGHTLEGAAPDPIPEAPPAAPVPALSEAERLAQHALLAAGIRQDAKTDALRLIATLAAAQPGTPGESFWRGALADLRELRLAGAAAAIAEALVAAHPDEPWPLLERAADPKLDPAAALAVGYRLYKISPDSPHGPRLVLRALRQQGRRSEQATFFATLPATFEGHDWYHASGAELAWADNAFEASLAHAEQLRHLAPTQVTGHTMAIASLRRLKRARDAKPLLAIAQAKFPDSPEVLREAALLAQAMSQNDRAFVLWEELRQRFPQSPAGFLGAIRLSRRLNQPETMARLVEQGLQAFPGHPALIAISTVSEADAPDSGEG